MSDSNTEAAPPSLSALRATLIHRDELPKNNKIGVASLSIGLIGLALIMLPFVTPACGLIGGCLGVIALVVSRRSGKPKRAAAWGVAIGVLAVGIGSISTAMLVQGWNHYRSCNQRYDPNSDSNENYACLHSH